MLLFGYLGELGVIDRMIGFVLGTIFWLYILYELFLGEAAKIRNTTKYSITCYGNQFTFFGDYFINDMDNGGRWKNPFKASGNRAQQAGWCSNASSGDANVGFIWINSRTGWDNVTICTCFETPCSEATNRLEDKLIIN